VPDPLLEVDGLTIEYLTDAADVRAVEDVSFSVGAGEFVGVVGESGCGKSTMLFGVAQLLSPPGEVTAGRVIFRGQDMVRLSAGELRHIDPAHLNSFPHQLSGGMRQRAMIAMALLFTPQLVMMDEPTSALDVVAQRSLMSKIRELQATLGFAVIFVTHDMHVVSRYCDRVLVMYAGQVVESAATENIFERPLHPYSRGLMDVFPSVTGPRRELVGIPGSPPDLAEPMSGCRFQPRCPVAMPVCAEVEPELYAVESSEVRCLLYTDVNGLGETG
jgi:peptide/nickel transport system ATP-binding protein